MKLAKRAFSPLYRLLERGDVYALNQLIAKPTTDRFRQLLSRVPKRSSVLDLGCGIGNYRSCFPGDYTGIDINPAYIERARAIMSGRFETMDCAALAFPNESFDDVVSIATTHHLNDEQFRAMIAEALRVCRPGGHFHVVDAILPVSPNFLLKTIWFRLDRGGFPRRLEELTRVIVRDARIVRHNVLTGPLHDTVYICIGRR
jgi:SAM-dependent methyltransferase